MSGYKQTESPADDTTMPTCSRHRTYASVSRARSLELLSREARLGEGVKPALLARPEARAHLSSELGARKLAEFSKIVVLLIFFYYISFFRCLFIITVMHKNKYSLNYKL